VRLQKFLSAAGACSRRKGEQFISQGRVRVNGVVITELGSRVDPEQDRVELDQKPVIIQKALAYVVLHKPRGYVTSCHHRGEPIVLDLVDIPQRIYPVGRLDKDSTGLLLLTNDGRLHHRLSHPSFDHEKEYDVVVSDPISDHALATLARGLTIDGVMTRPARIQRLGASRFRIVLQEGRKRQIRRMAEHVGSRVMELKRIRMACISLGDLSPGQWRHLTSAERAQLLEQIEIRPDEPSRVPLPPANTTNSQPGKRRRPFTTAVRPTGRSRRKK
jgi:pseudouridine synthase